MKLLYLLIFSVISSAAQLTGSIPFKTEVLHANQLDNEQWYQIRRLWMESFYNAYKNLPLQQIDSMIQDDSQEALRDYLKKRFHECEKIALEKDYIFTLIYKDDAVIAYTLHHVLAKNRSIVIDHFAVSPCFQSQGVGTHLLQEVLTKNPGIESVVLSTRILNSTARRFYEKQGFYQIDSMDDVVFNPSFSVLLKKDIS